MNRSTRMLTVSAGMFAAAFAGLMAGCKSQSTGGEAGSSVTSADLNKHACKGANECKGHGGCKTADNACKGQNACKGKGGCKTLE